MTKALRLGGDPRHWAYRHTDRDKGRSEGRGILRCLRSSGKFEGGEHCLRNSSGLRLDSCMATLEDVLSKRNADAVVRAVFESLSYNVH
jgi:hypothetical protein